MFYLIFEIRYLGTHIFTFLRFCGQNRLQHDSAFQPFFLQFTAILIWLADVTIDKISISMTASTTEKSSPTSTAFCLSHHMSLSDIFVPDQVLRHLFPTFLICILLCLQTDDMDKCRLRALWQNIHAQHRSLLNV